MKKMLLTLLLVCMVLPLVVPVSAARPQPVGEQIGLWIEDPMDFPEGEPFHIAHGWTIDPSAGYPVGKFAFDLEIDGVPVDADFVLREYIPGEEEPLLRLWVHNFPDGMSGSHSFTGHWFAPCQYVVDYGDYPGPCPDPREVVQVRSSTRVVEFTP